MVTNRLKNLTIHFQPILLLEIYQKMEQRFYWEEKTVNVLSYLDCIINETYTKFIIPIIKEIYIFDGQFLEVKVWTRDVNSGQSVEEVLTKYQPSQTISLCFVAGQGESVAIENSGAGFYTVSESPGEDDGKIDVNVPIYFYSIKGTYQDHFKQQWVKYNFIYQCKCHVIPLFLFNRTK